ncbi:MAG: response regulator, partial [Cellulosilyticaceae bacterium]
VLSLAPKNTYYNPVPATALDAQRQKVKLVLADDSKTVRAMLENALHGSGYDNLTFFNDGAAALNYFMELKSQYGTHFEEHATLLITDIEMPKLDGYTLTRQLKEDPILCTLPVIIFSSLITDELYHKGKQVGAEAQISKPSLKKLVHIIDEIIDIESL